MLSDSDTFTLLIVLIVGAIIVIGWAVATLPDEDGRD